LAVNRIKRFDDLTMMIQLDDLRARTFCRSRSRPLKTARWSFPGIAFARWVPGRTAVARKRNLSDLGEVILLPGLINAIATSTIPTWPECCRAEKPSPTGFRSSLRQIRLGYSDYARSC